MQEEDNVQPFELALSPVERKVARSLMAASGADENFRVTLRAIAGKGFTQAELDELEERMLRNVTKHEVGVLYGIVGGVPVVVSPNQKATIDRLIGQAGSDELGRRAKEGYGRAVQAGQIRVR